MLLKNDRALPLTGKARKIAVIGPTASSTPTNGVSAASVCGTTRPTVPCTPIAPLDAITARPRRRRHGDVQRRQPTPPRRRPRPPPPTWRSSSATTPRASSSDPADIALDGNGDALIAAVAAANRNTVVVLQTGGPVTMPWLSKVKAVLEVWYAGEQMGPAIASLLWGDVNPSGRLTHTFPRSEADLPTAGSPRQYPGVFADGSTTRPPGSTEIRQVDYLEGLKVGYRWYDAERIKPLFPFGHGLSYTKFDYGKLQVSPQVATGRPVDPRAVPRDQHRLADRHRGRAGLRRACRAGPASRPSASSAGSA